MTYASYITSLRIVLIIPIIILTYAQTTLFNFLALFLFIIAGLTDYFDGFIARLLKTESKIGVSCRKCDRLDCSQRAFPPATQKYDVNINQRGVSIFVNE